MIARWRLSDPAPVLAFGYIYSDQIVPVVTREPGLHSVLRLGGNHEAMPGCLGKVFTSGRLTFGGMGEGSVVARRRRDVVRRFVLLFALDAKN